MAQNAFNESTTEDDEAVRLTAALEFEAWLPDQEPEMTPENLAEAGRGGPFLATYVAYRLMFQSKTELVAHCRQTPDVAPEIVNIISDGAEWYKRIAKMMRAAELRILAAASVVELEVTA